MIDAKANGYQELPDFPEEQPDTSVRNVEVTISTGYFLCNDIIYDIILFVAVS